MLKENKNRGAGLVTVIVVLAVSSILLSASVWLSFQHYKNVMTAQTDDTERAELDLCAEIVCMMINRNESITFENVGLSSSELLTFYGMTPENEISHDDSEIVIQESVGVELRLSEYVENDFKKGLLIQYLRNGEVIVQEIYTFEKVDGTYRVSYFTPEESSDETTGGGV